MSDYKYVKFDRTRNTLFALGTEADPETIYLTTEGKIINNGNKFGGDEQLLSDWQLTDTTAKDYIKNKPIIPAAQVNADWEATEGIAEILNKPYVPSVINDTTSTSTTEALSANMGKELLDEINNLKSRGRFLSLWKCTTGLPETVPTTLPYDYHTGDYFIVSEVAGSTPVGGRYKHQIHMEGLDTSESINYSVNYEFESDDSAEYTQFSQVYNGLYTEGYFDRNALTATGTFGEFEITWISVDSVMPIVIFSRGEERAQLGNAVGLTAITDTVTPLNTTTNSEVNYRPNGSQYTGEASTTVETEEVKINDTYYYDGSEWKLLKDTGKIVTFANVTGDPYSNAELANALNLKADQTDLTAHISDTENPHQVTASQVGLGNVDNTSDLDKPISTATQTALDTKLPTLVSGGNIKTVNKNSLLITDLETNLNIPTFKAMPTFEALNEALLAKYPEEPELHYIHDMNTFGEAIIAYGINYGDAWLGEVDTGNISDLPTGIGNSEIQIYCNKEDGLLVFTMTSTDTAPFNWIALYYGGMIENELWDRLIWFGHGMPQILSDWNLSDNTYADYIKNKPTTLSSFTDDLGSSPVHTHSQYLTSHQDISGKEDTSNKVISWNTTTTNTNYPSEKLVKDECDNIREVAEGKCASYILDCARPQNEAFESQNSSVYATSFFDENKGLILLSNLKLGDVLYIIQLGYPDRWYSGNDLSIRDLTGKNYSFNSTFPESFTTEILYLNTSFTSNSESFVQLLVENGLIGYRRSDTSVLIVYNGTSWTDPLLQNITFTSATNSSIERLFYKKYGTFEDSSITLAGIFQIMETAKVPVTGVEMDNTSVVSDNTANLYTINGDYNANTNKLATATDLSAYLPLIGGTLTGEVTSTSNIRAAAFYETSDKRFKNIHGELSLDKAYEVIEKCSTILYDLKTDDSHKEQVGMIAQEVEEFFPEVIHTDDNGIKSIDYSRLTVIIFKVLKDMLNRLNNLELK